MVGHLWNYLNWFWIPTPGNNITTAKQKHKIRINSFFAASLDAQVIIRFATYYGQDL